MLHRPMVARRHDINPLGIIALFIVLVYGFAALVITFSGSLSSLYNPQGHGHAGGITVEVDAGVVSPAPPFHDRRIHLRLINGLPGEACVPRHTMC